MKKILISFCLVSMLGSTADAASFSDLNAENKYFKAVEFLSEKGVVSGYPDGSFKTDQLVNRAEAMKMIVNAFAVPEAPLLQEKFPDVKIDEWFFDFVMNAEKAGIINGYPDNTFKPGANVNFAESLKMAILAGKFNISEGINGDVFLDVKQSEWFAKFFLMARDNFVVTSDQWGLVDPGQAMTRGKFAEMVYRLLIIRDSGGLPYPIEEDWDTYNSKGLGIDLKFDKELWKVEEGMNSLAIWRQDLTNGQFTVGRVFPNTGKIWIAVDSNKDGLASDQYFASKQAIFKDAKFSNLEIGGLKTLEVYFADQRKIDWYIYRNDKSVIGVYGESGNGAMAPELEKNIRKIVSTLKVTGAAVEKPKDLLSEIFANILVEGAGKKSLELMTDEILIETDSIGVGTGPVDYYFSSSLNYTFKYERASDVILDKKEGETSAF